MIVDPGDISAEESYKLLTGIVVPRPIAWVTTLNAQGRVNLAPFSAFTFVSPKYVKHMFSTFQKRVPKHSIL